MRREAAAAASSAPPHVPPLGLGHPLPPLLCPVLSQSLPRSGEGREAGLPPIVRGVWKHSTRDINVYDCMTVVRTVIGCLPIPDSSLLLVCVTQTSACQWCGVRVQQRNTTRVFSYTLLLRTLLVCEQPLQFKRGEQLHTQRQLQPAAHRSSLDGSRCSALHACIYRARRDNVSRSDVSIYTRTRTSYRTRHVLERGPNGAFPYVMRRMTFSAPSAT